MSLFILPIFKVIIGLKVKNGKIDKQDELVKKLTIALQSKQLVRIGPIATSLAIEPLLTTLTSGRKQISRKIPPELKRESVRCTRCGRDHPVPKAEAVKEAADAASPLRFVRTGKGWESFKCACGAVQQISPAFRGDSLTCKSCRRKIELTGP